MRLEDIEDEQDDVRNIRASYHKQTVEVYWDENLVNEERIAAAIRAKRLHS